MLRKLIALCVIVISFGATTTAQANKSRTEPVKIACPKIVNGVEFYRNAAWHWQDKLGQTRTRSNFNPNHVKSCLYAVWVAHQWKARATKLRRSYTKMLAERRAEFQSLYNKWACIHRYEGAWNSNTGNGYYGGLQMDYGFMQTYGPEFLARWGTANNWPVWAQLKTAERAYATRGYGPWPNTARACGLL